LSGGEVVNRFLPAVSIAVLLLFFSADSAAQRTPSAEVVMQKVATKLAKVKALGYTYTREFNYPSEDYLSKSISTGYLDLKAPDGALGFRYQFSDDEYLAIYNGSENFIGIKKKKTMVVTSNPSADRMDSSSSLYNSPLTLRNALPKILADNKILKTISTDAQGRYLLEFTLHNASISGLGEIRELRSERTSIYRLTIDPKTFLPIEVLVTNDKNKDFTKTTFSDLTEKPKLPSDLSWYFSSYTDEYKLEQPVEKKLVEVGKTPPDFVLRQLDTGSDAALKTYKGKVVLLEFWIAHCGFCIAAVPKLNEIVKAFKGPEFAMMSINIHDPAATIAGFKDRHKPEYAILVEGESTGDAYGVGSYPAIVLIGRDGKIAYSSLGLFEKDLEAAIKSSLEK
jgi:thiol-disulfide isomerase/thioredoxin/outer membrane lipoprotein-sorting protein